MEISPSLEHTLMHAREWKEVCSRKCGETVWRLLAFVHHVQWRVV